MKKADYENLSVFEQLEAGLKQAVAQAKGELTLKTTELPLPAPELSSRRVKSIRLKLRMSQGVLATCLNVPKRTLESWEQGRRTPKAGEARLLQILEADPEVTLRLIAASSRSTVKRSIKRDRVRSPRKLNDVSVSKVRKAS